MRYTATDARGELCREDCQHKQTSGNRRKTKNKDFMVAQDADAQGGTAAHSSSSGSDQGDGRKAAVASGDVAWDQIYCYRQGDPVVRAPSYE